MAKSLEQLQNSSAGNTAESNGFGSSEKPFRPAGLYRLKDEEGNVVDEQIVKSHPLFGDSQAAAFERVGYRFVREAKPGEVKEMELTPNPGLSGDNKEDLKGLQARMSAFEAQTKAKDDEIAALKAELAQRDTTDADKQDSENAKVAALQNADTKAEATARVAAREDSATAAGAEETAKTEELKNESAKTESDSKASDTKTNDKKASK